VKHVAPPHLPAADLGLTDDELHALLWVTERLEDGRIGDDEFNMDLPEICIGGHMGAQLCRPKLVDDLDAGPIGKLFYPPIERRTINGGVHAIRHPAWTAGPRTAARACRQFLATGAVDWDAAIKGAE
jgi:hypothetical protein